MSLTTSFINAGGYWSINKQLAKAIGIKETVFLMELVYIWEILKNNKDNPGWVFKQQSEIEKATGISKATQTRYINKLVGMKFLSVKRIGAQSRKNYYKINDHVIDEYLINMSKTPSTQNEGLQNEDKNDIGGNKGDALKMRASRTQNEGTNIISNINKEEFTKVNSGLCPLGSEAIKETTDEKNKPLETKRAQLKNVKHTTPEPLNPKHLHKETIELLEYWNTFDTLTTHSLAKKRNVDPLHKQSKRVKDINKIIYQVIHGKFYSQHTGIQVGLKTKKYTVDKIKQVIDKIAIACSPEYNFSQKRISMIDFFHNPYVKPNEKLSAAKKLRFTHPFLYYLNNDPVALSNSPTKRNTEYSVLVDRTIKKLTGTVKPNDRQYNQVVVQIDKAMLFIKRISNGNLAENRMKLPVMLIDTMQENQIPLTVDGLPLGVYNLEKFMKKRLMIS